MDIRTLQSLRLGIPILLRHLGAYLELAEQDLQVTTANAVASLRLLAVFIVSGLFTLLTVCMLVVALAWDSPYRLLAVGLMGGVFALLTTVTGIYLARRRSPQLFAGVRREWQQDRAVVHRLLADK